MSDLKETAEKSAQPETKVVNLYREEFDVYIGRKGKGQDGYFGNPYDMRNFSRAECLEMYRQWFERKIEYDSVFREKVLRLRGKRLGCFCKPKACHGDIIVAWLKQWEETHLQAPRQASEFDSDLRKMANLVDEANLPEDVKDNVPEVQMHEGVALGGKQFKIWFNENKAFLMTRVCQQRTALFNSVQTPMLTEQEHDHNLYVEKKRRIMESLTG
jgi:hypothetical protein